MAEQCRLLADDAAPESAGQCRKKARRRRQIIDEIMMTEETYHKHMKLMVDYFEIPLRAQKLLPHHTISVIFGNIQQLIQVNNELRLHLEEMDVGQAFLQMAPFLKLYSVYAKNHQLAITTLQDVEAKNMELINFRARQETRPEVQMKLNALLITPVQRVPRYKLLLDELLTYTPSSDPDYSALKTAVKQITTVAKHINDHLEEHENFQKMISIQKALEGSGAPKIVAPGRRFVKEGILRRMSRKGGRSYERMFFLFSDMLMYSKPKLVDNGNRNYSCCCVLPLHHCSVETMFGSTSSEDGGAMFKLSCKDETLLLYSENKETITIWMNVLQDAIKQVKQSRLTLRKESSAKRPMRRSALMREKRKQNLKQMRDEIKASDMTPGNTGHCTPRSCKKSGQAVIKYTKILIEGDGLCCTPKKRLRLESDKDDRITVEDSFEVIDSNEMDDFNVTMPQFFKQLSTNHIPGMTDSSEPSAEESDHPPTCSHIPDAHHLKCDHALATWNKLKKSRCGQTIQGSIRSLARMKKKIRKRCHSENFERPDLMQNTFSANENHNQEGGTNSAEEFVNFEPKLDDSDSSTMEIHEPCSVENGRNRTSTNSLPLPNNVEKVSRHFLKRRSAPLVSYVGLPSVCPTVEEEDELPTSTTGEAEDNRRSSCVIL